MTIKSIHGPSLWVWRDYIILNDPYTSILRNVSESTRSKASRARIPFTFCYTLNPIRIYPREIIEEI